MGPNPIERFSMHRNKFFTVVLEGLSLHWGWGIKRIKWFYYYNIFIMHVLHLCCSCVDIHVSLCSILVCCPVGHHIHLRNLGRNSGLCVPWRGRAVSGF